jgi:hypothetical protein
MPIVDTDFRKGDSVTIEINNRPYVDRSIPATANDTRNADSASIKVYDPCNLLFVDCPMIACQDRIGWYLFRIQTDDEFPVGLYKVEVKLENIVPETYGSCSTGTSGTSGVGTSGTSGTSGSPSSNIAASIAIKYFRLLDKVTY